MFPINLSLSGTVVLASVLALFVPGLGEAATRYQEVAVADGGSVRGHVTFVGELPKGSVEMVAIKKNNEVCGTGKRQLSWIDVNRAEGGDGLRGVFVFIDAIDKGKRWTTTVSNSGSITQEGCQFSPWAQVVRPGLVTIHNGDEGVLHNISAREILDPKSGSTKRRPLFSVGQPNTGDITQRLVPRRSSFIAINCETHPFMFGYIMSPKNPYAVVVDQEGFYSMDDIPPGEYTLKAWHPKLGMKKSEITVTPFSVSTIDFPYISSVKKKKK